MTPFRRNRCHAHLLTLALIFSATATSAGVAIHSETTKAGEEPERATLLIQGQNLRIDTERKSGEGVIFNGERQELMILSPDDKKYMVLDRDAMTKLGGQVNQAMAMMQEKLASMPPEQRAMVEKMMKDRGMSPTAPAKAAPKLAITLKKTGETMEIDGRKCRRTDLYRGDEKVAEAWLATFAEAGVPEDTFAVFQSMSAFFEELLDGLGSSPMLAEMAESGGLMAGLKALDGFPLRIRELSDGETSSETRILSTEERKLTADAFAPPAGYTRRELPTAAMPGGR